MKIGIDIGGSHIAIGVVNNDGIIVEKIEKRLTQKEKTNRISWNSCSRNYKRWCYFMGW